MKSTKEMTIKAIEEMSLLITAKTDSELCCWYCGKKVKIRGNYLPQISDIRCRDCRNIEESNYEEKIVYENEFRKIQFLKSIPPAFRDTDSSKLPFPEKLDAALRWEFGPKGILFYGPTGSGKSRVMWEVAKREGLSGKGIRVLNAFDIMLYPALFLKPDDAAGHFAREMAQTQLLLLDDVFKAKPTERIEELLFAILDQRGANNLPCLITLNDTGDSLESRLSSDRGPALIRRLREYCDTIKFV